MSSRSTRFTTMLRRRYGHMRGRLSDAGYSVTEWAYITAAGGGIATIIYLAIDGTARSKAMEIAGL
ncbi:hypothetical protein [Streptomyces sp. NPDC014685]|uniref:hypothetical protein n=1 Tax=Streptomyces sp. NPDC014685 TaxID=3364881 RepID=UPI0036F87C03